jgi:hypothetical protein
VPEWDRLRRLITWDNKRTREVGSMKGRSLVFVVALLVVVVAVALVVPFAGAVARVGGDGSVAAECQSGHACGGAPLAAKCQSGTACGGSVIAAITPTPPAPDAMCQSGTSCGG